MKPVQDKLEYFKELIVILEKKDPFKNFISLISQS